MNSSEQEQLFRRWLAEHAGLIWKAVRAFTSTREDAEDLFQDTAMQLWISLPAFRGEARESTWIYRVAFNTALAWQRQSKRQKAKHERFAALQIAPQADPGHSHGASGDEMIASLYAAIRQLPGLDASLALMHLDGLSYREMSEVSGLSENHVGVKLSRIRAHLAEQLKGAMHEL
jgi:RNA polymerase sigma-70 factor (ECF subfamily)